MAKIWLLPHHFDQNGLLSWTISVVQVCAVIVLMLNKCSQANDLNKNNGIMLPNVAQRVVNASSNVSITCMFIHSAAIEWILPKDPSAAVSVLLFYKRIYRLIYRCLFVYQLSKRAERVVRTIFMNDTHVSSTMTLTKARATDTGLYECFLPQFPELRVKQYIYVYSKY